ncbi:hypothetical protein UY3_14796 [Chelonia mydas]|uniref:Uncharacterized protein n=1 Tax=Chelonia mydas TaxID=8469 RepID=M7AYG4_CHEMY|nr:hypothetical protein UY3_14796 [Chelonia mydas]
MGAAGSSGQHIPRPTPLLPAAPIGLERRTAARGSCDRPNLQTQQCLAHGALIPVTASRCCCTTNNNTHFSKNKQINEKPNKGPKQKYAIHARKMDLKIGLTQKMAAAPPNSQSEPKGSPSASVESKLHSKSDLDLYLDPNIALPALLSLLILKSFTDILQTFVALFTQGERLKSITWNSSVPTVPVLLDKCEIPPMPNGFKRCEKPFDVSLCPVDTSESAERGGNPEAEILDEEVELEEDVELPVGSTGGAGSQELFSSPEVLHGEQKVEETPARTWKITPCPPADRLRQIRKNPRPSKEDMSRQVLQRDEDQGTRRVLGS